MQLRGFDVSFDLILSASLPSQQPPRHPAVIDLFIVSISMLRWMMLLMLACVRKSSN